MLDLDLAKAEDRPNESVEIQLNWFQRHELTERCVGSGTLTGSTPAERLNFCCLYCSDLRHRQEGLTDPTARRAPSAF